MQFRIKIFLLLLVLPVIALSQYEYEYVKYNSYYNSFTRDSVEITLQFPKTEDTCITPDYSMDESACELRGCWYSVDIEAIPLDNSYYGNLTMTTYQQGLFLKYLKKVRVQYAKWLSKKAPLGKNLKPKKFKKEHGAGSAFYQNGKFYYRTWNEMQYECKVVELKGKYYPVLILYTSEILGLREDDMKTVDGFILTFASLEEFDQFLKSISIDYVQGIIRNHKSGN